MNTTTNKLELIRSNIEVHGLKWAAGHQRLMFRGKPCGENSFDTFYYAVFGKFPTRKFTATTTTTTTEKDKK